MIREEEKRLICCSNHHRFTSLRNVFIVMLGIIFVCCSRYSFAITRQWARGGGLYDTNRHSHDKINVPRSDYSRGVESNNNTSVSVSNKIPKHNHTLLTSSIVNQPSTAWVHPDTSFTPHILTLVDFYKQNYQYCQDDPPTNRLVQIQISVPSVNATPIVRHLTRKRFKFNLKRWFDETVLAGRMLPPGNITIAFSKSDKDSPDTLCQFANSSPKGEHAIYNFQNMGHLIKNITYPEALKWDERSSIPVFRGRMWGLGSSYLNMIQTELQNNLQSDNMSAEVARDIFFERALHSPDEEYGLNDTRYQRLPLAYFSFANPDLVNARLSPPPDRNIEMVSLWANNATNGLSRVLPFDEIPAEEYYSKYQTHIVMGGYGAAFRTARILGQGIAVILQEYPYEEWFTHLMVPNVHYIPLNETCLTLMKHYIG